MVYVTYHRGDEFNRFICHACNLIAGRANSANPAIRLVARGTKGNEGYSEELEVKVPEQGRSYTISCGLSH